MEPIRLWSIGVSVYRVPIETPVQTSFGVLRDRAAVVVHMIDEDGCEGWGEIWCNFPTVGAEHRAGLLAETVAPLALSRAWACPADCYEALTAAVRILAIQSGEPGPLAQVVAGVDIAMWDLAARRAQVPLWRLLGGRSGAVKVYASGLNPTQPERLAAAKAAEGHTTFKLKVGFGAERDVANLSSLRSTLGDSVGLMVDANQAWDVEEASMMAERLAAFKPLWLEEPIAADAPIDDWRRLAHRAPVPLAAGENLRAGDFARFLDARCLKVLQPDVAKWGGFTGCLPLAQAAATASAWLCPHWLGGGIGLLATLHLKAAIGGEGFAEVDANRNPLRELLAGEALQVRDGAVTLPELAGCGARPELSALAPYLILEHTIKSRQFSKGDKNE
ncbi:Putative isomerase YitF [Variovorax sp. PBS-H4]|uniref:mandelate racemase/muconate lactonizing enzyme family protein n=1 Tax=Variovorax sp. PBS-H4 TaxID=434008 RepID=UPI001316D1F9|nr:mandelate racemase/muconate lactonizing enzyme family protein [Variovorax sp. PBS-H4]VTU40760.1 Putative isomerase YitF [Variovorax sp. PBS-H4]